MYTNAAVIDYAVAVSPAALILVTAAALPVAAAYVGP